MLVIGWLATGQSLGGIDDYVSSGFQIVSGYSEAMGFQDPLTGWERTAALLLAGVGFAVAWRAGELLPRRARLGLVALWAVLAFTTFKAGFVRQDPAHVNIFFASLLGGLVAFGWAPHRRQTAWLLGALFAVVMMASARAELPDLVSPVTRAGKLADQARTLAGPDRTASAIAAARAARIGYEQLDARFVRAVGRRTVHVEPIDAGAAWAHNLRWHPLPVFQSYSAYTQALDERNAATARDPDGPETILREATITFDNRNPAFESPEAMRAILCHFRAPGPALGRWILLERVAPRCGAERPLKTVKAKLGVPAAVPPPPDANSAVFVRIDGIEVKGLEKLRATLYRALERHIAFDGGRINRLVPGTAADGIVLRVPPRADYPTAVRARPGHQHHHRGQVRAPGRPAAALLLDAHPLACRPDARVHRHQRGGAAVRPRAGRLAGPRPPDGARARRTRACARTSRSTSCARATSRAWRRGGCSAAPSTPPRAIWSRACSPTSARRCCWPPTCWCWSRSTRCRGTSSPSSRACSSRSRARRCSRTGCSTPA